MAWRFKASKYKNATPIVPKPEACIRDISVGSYQTYGNNITASAAFMAFNVDHNGSSLAVLPIDDCGRKSKLMPLLHGHSDTVTDMDFSPFHDGLLATGSQDCLVKLWHIPEVGVEESITSPECTFYHKQRRVETVCFHPTADCLLTSTSFTTLTLWDITSEKELFSNQDHPECIQCVSWRKDGSLLATTCKDKQVRVLDPRCNPASGVFSHTANSHLSIKDSRVIWVGDQNKILTTGFDSGRQREVFIRDLRNFEEPEKVLTLDSSTGILIPLYDADTGMLFLAGKGDTTIAYMEVMDREPFLIEGIRHNGEQTKGACLVPKRALNVMQGEVNRVLQLTSTSVIPIMYQVPRKSYREFHSDLFPETNGCDAQLAATQWMEGGNVPVKRISLDPAKQESGLQHSQVHRGPLSAVRKQLEENPHKIPQKGFLNKNKLYQPMIKPSFEDNKQVKEKNNENGNHHNILNGLNNRPLGENGSGSVIAPKPMPRRANSISESDDTSSAKPVARPRTCSVTQPCALPIAVSPLVVVSTASIPAPLITTPALMTMPTSVVTSVNPAAPISGGYKPRLGPKPFSAPKRGNGESESPKPELYVDCGPSPPPSLGPLSGFNGSGKSFGMGSANTSTDVAENQEDEPPKSPVKTAIENLERGMSPTKWEKKICAEDEIKGDSRAESPIDDDDSPNEKARTPTTAERRKLFETESLGAEVDAAGAKPDDEDKIGDFERMSVQRSSIADRRRLYENRSMSVQEDKKITTSPTPLRRKDSLKKDSREESPTKPSPMNRQHSLEQPKQGEMKEVATTPTPKRTSTVFGRVSKFRHLKGTPMHKSTHIENVRNISRQISGECDGFHANRHRVAVPLEGPGGKIAVFELTKTGKLPDGVVPTLVHGTNVMDFSWDPFNTARLAVGCDDGTIKLWVVPESGLSEPTNTPAVELAGGHTEKIYSIKFHPLASDVLASAAYDMTIRIWDLATGLVKILLEGHTDHIFCMAWSPCGVYLATVSRDSKIRIYNPRNSRTPIREGKGPVGSRGARVVWALEGSFLVVLGFDKVSERQILVFSCGDLNTPLNTVGLDVSPAILIPFYDEDSSTLFLTGRGDSTIYTYEVTEEAPFLCALSPYRSTVLHQGLSFLPKCECDVAAVEFARALRLSNNVIEPMSFTVPRIKSELFQDDLFPPTKNTWTPVLTSERWFSGVNQQQQRVSLKPEGMENLTGTQLAEKQPAGKATGPGSFAGAQQPFNRLGWNADISGATKEKQEQIQRAVSNRMELNLRLEQDEMEGVDEREWSHLEDGNTNPNAFLMGTCILHCQRLWNANRP